MATPSHALQQTPWRLSNKTKKVRWFKARKKSNKDLLDNLDRIVKINEYKEIQKLLNPISLVQLDWVRKRSTRKNRENLLPTLLRLYTSISKWKAALEKKCKRDNVLLTNSKPYQQSNLPSGSPIASPLKSSNIVISLELSKKCYMFLPLN